MSGEAFGEALGVKKQTVSNWENERNQPDLDQLAAICRVLDASADWLVMGTSGVNYSALQFAFRYSKLSDAERARWERLLEAARDEPREFSDATEFREVSAWKEKGQGTVISEGEHANKARRRK